MTLTRYFYKLTRQEMLDKSQNEGLKRDLTSTVNSRSHSGIDQCYTDAKRDLLVSEKKLDKSEIKADADRSELDSFKKWLKENALISPENIELLGQHYSQAPSLFGASTMQSYCTHEADIGLVIKSPETVNRMYEKDGVVYFHMHHENYPVELANQVGDYTQVGVIKGPVEVLFKLTQNGFEFQEAYTQSELLRDMFLGKPITKEKILYHCPEYLINDLKSPINELEGKEQQLLKIQQKNPKKFSDKNTLELRSIQGVLKAVSRYQKNEINLDELQQHIAFNQELAAGTSSALQKARSFFQKKPPKATKIILAEMLHKVELMNHGPVKIEQERAAKSPRSS